MPVSGNSHRGLHSDRPAWRTMIRARSSPRSCAHHAATAALVRTTLGQGVSSRWFDRPWTPGASACTPVTAIRSPARVRDVAAQQVEAVMAGAGGNDLAHASARGAGRGQKARHQRAARRCERVEPCGLAHVGQQSPAARAGHAEPGAAAREIAPGEPAFVPPLRRGGRTGVVFVAIGGDHDLEARVDAQRKRRQGTSRVIRRCGQRARGAAAPRAVPVQWRQRRKALGVAFAVGRESVDRCVRASAASWQMNARRRRPARRSPSRSRRRPSARTAVRPRPVASATMAMNIATVSRAAASSAPMR